MTNGPSPLLSFSRHCSLQHCFAKPQSWTLLVPGALRVHQQRGFKQAIKVLIFSTGHIPVTTESRTKAPLETG